MGRVCAGVGKSTLLLQVAAMLGSESVAGPPQPSLLSEEEVIEGEAGDDNGEDTEDRETAEEEEQEEELQDPLSSCCKP